MPEKVDKSALKFNQIFIVLLVSVSFVINLPGLIALTSAVMIIGSLFQEASLFRIVYLNIIKPSGIMKPEIVHESNSPHLFSQRMGGIVLLISFLLLEFIQTGTGIITGWSISILVAVLAFINVALNFCTGCWIYFQLQKSGLIHAKRKSSHA